MSKSRRLDLFDNNGIHSVVKNRFLNHRVETRCYQMGRAYGSYKFPFPANTFPASTPIFGLLLMA